MNYARAKQIAQKMFGPTARVERGKTKDGPWAILVQQKNKWVMTGHGGSFDQMLRDAARRATTAKMRIAAEKKAASTTSSGEGDVP